LVVTTACAPRPSEELSSCPLHESSDPPRYAPRQTGDPVQEALRAERIREVGDVNCLTCGVKLSILDAIFRGRACSTCHRAYKAAQRADSRAAKTTQRAAAAAARNEREREARVKRQTAAKVKSERRTKAESLKQARRAERATEKEAAEALKMTTRRKQEDARSAGRAERRAGKSARRWLRHQEGWRLDDDLLRNELNERYPSLPANAVEKLVRGRCARREAFLRERKRLDAEMWEVTNIWRLPAELRNRFVWRPESYELTERVKERLQDPLLAEARDWTDEEGWLSLSEFDFHSRFRHRFPSLPAEESEAFFERALRKQRSNPAEYRKHSRHEGERRRQHRLQKRQARHEAKMSAYRRKEEELWKTREFKAGEYRVELTEVGDENSVELADLLATLPMFRSLDASAWDVIDRVAHISPEVIAEGVSQYDAISLKKALEGRNAGAAIRRSYNNPTRREAIPERVRHEVWRRDQGRCVVCGSQERLEFDHIIPLVKGGSNTARNIQLLCESCNRQKGAAI
jgi:hypothetical protein